MVRLVPALDLRRAGEAPEPSLPMNIEAEQALLGCVLYDNEAFYACEGVAPDTFYEPVHGRVWAALDAYISKGQLAEPILLAEKFARDEGFNELGGISYLALLLDKAPAPSAARDYARLLIDLAQRRRMIGVAAEVSTAARQDHERSSTAILEDAEQALHDLAESSGGRKGLLPFSVHLRGAIDMAAAACDRRGGVSGLSTGLIDLDRKLGGLHPSDLVILAARPSMGKAQPLSSRVLMQDGTWKRMGDLRLGDRLASVDGAPSRVAGVFPQGERQLYRLTFSDGRSTRACGEHLWSIRSSKLAGGRVVTTDQLRKMLTQERFRRRITIPLASGHFGHDRDLPVEPWLLGALIGNGCMVDGHMSFSTADAATLYKVQAAVGHDCVVPAGGDYDYRLNCGRDLRGALRSLGLYGKGSAEKFIPPAYLSASRESRLQLMRGLLDTDGWVETFGVIRYATASRQLADDVAALARSLGGLCTISVKAPTFTHKGERRAGLPSYVCNIRHPDRASLISLKRKQRRCEEQMRWRNPSLVSIEPAGVEPAQCIQVTHPSSLYITDDYIVTHNTALATNIAFNLARNYQAERQPDGALKTVSGGVVAFFSLEMSGEQLALRILSEASGISGDRIRRGEIDPGEFGRLRDAAILVNEIPLHVDATAGQSVAQMAAKARRLKRTSGLDLIVVDYLQLASSPGRRGEGRVQEVSDITAGLKGLAKDLNVPVVALSQLSRQVENRDDKRPQLADLRESGSIEQDADVVMFLYREAYYLSRAEPREGTAEHAKWQEDMDHARGLAEVIIGKQRHGPIGTVKLAFNDDLTKFDNLARGGRFDGARMYGSDE